MGVNNSIALSNPRVSDEKSIPISSPYVEKIQKFHATCSTCEPGSTAKLANEISHNYGTRAKQRAQNQLVNFRKLHLNSEQKEFVAKKISENTLKSTMLIKVMNLYAKDIFSFYIEDILAHGGGPFVNLYGRIDVISQSFQSKRYEMMILKQEVKRIESEFHKIVNNVQTSQQYEVDGKIINIKHASDWIEVMCFLENMLNNIKTKVLAHTN